MLLLDSTQTARPLLRCRNFVAQDRQRRARSLAARSALQKFEARNAIYCRTRPTAGVCLVGIGKYSLQVCVAFVSTLVPACYLQVQVTTSAAC